MAEAKAAPLSLEQLQELPVDQIPSDPAAIMRALDGTTGGTGDEADPLSTDANTETAKAVEEAEATAKAAADAKAKEDADAKAKADADAAAAAAAAAKGETKTETPTGEKQPDGVLLKDGKTVIPYETLAAARRREDEERNRANAEAEARRNAEARVAELTREAENLKAGKAADGTEAKPGDFDALKERINALKDNVPEVGEVLDELLGHLGKATTEIETLRTRRAEDDNRVAVETQATVQETIDKNPTLRYLQAENRDLFNEAARIDRTLRESTDPRIQSLSMEERFARVVKALEVTHGPIELPEKYRPAAPAVDAAAKAKADADAKAKADEQARAKAKGRDETMTLSDLPGGAPPVGERQSVAEMSQADIDRQVQSMLDKGKSVTEIMAVLDA